MTRIASVPLLLQEREFLVECAPLGKFARVVHDFANKRSLPAPFVIWGLVSTFPGCVFLGWVACMVGTKAAITIGNSVLLVLLPILVLLAFVLSKPTHVEFTPEGLRNCWRRTFSFYGPVLKWTDMQRIAVVQPANTSREQSRLLSFEGGGKQIALKIDQVTDMAMLPAMYNMILQCAPVVPRDPDVQSILGSDKENASYTELWLKALTAPPDRERLSPLDEGTSLQDGEYVVHRQIGAGGQGVAYTATKRTGEFTGTVVLKEYVLPVGVSHAVKVESLEKFQREAQILGQISHPQIVRLIDFFFEDHRGYMVLEYVQGVTLSGLVRSAGALDEQTVAKLALQMTDVLEYLHGQDPPVVHRDFTPDNLILTDAGVLKLIDFNVAQQRRTSATATVVGKHAYIAPDQFRGQVSAQSDIYSMGATLYFLLTASEPKPITTSHPRQKNDRVSACMDEVVAGCTAIDPQVRFKNLAEVRAALQALHAEPAL